MQKRPLHRLLVTGGCGFIGSAFIRWTLKNYPQVSIINLDKLTYAATKKKDRRILSVSVCFGRHQ